jgi:hypothetical protein
MFSWFLLPLQGPMAPLAAIHQPDSFYFQVHPGTVSKPCSRATPARFSRSGMLP